MKRPGRLLLLALIVIGGGICGVLMSQLFDHTLASFGTFGFVRDSTPEELLADRYTVYTRIEASRSCPPGWYSSESSDPAEWLRQPYDLTLDESGVVVRNYGWNYRIASWEYSPQFVGWFGMVGLRSWCQSGDSLGLEIARRQSEWLLASADTANGVAVWRYRFPNPRFRGPDGWTGGIANGFAMVLLNQIWAVTGDARYHRMALRAADAYAVPIRGGGLQSLMPDGRSRWFEEVAHRSISRPSHILNGHILALFALDYLANNAEYPPAGRLRDDGIEAVRRYMTAFDAGTTTYYSLDPRVKVQPNHYAHRIHVDGLYWMAEVTGDKDFLSTAERWRNMMKQGGR